MKHFSRCLLSVVFLAGCGSVGLAQDCTQNVSLPTAAPSGKGPSFSNSSRGCNHWVFQYSSFGVVGVTIQVETASDAGGAPGAWAVVPAASILVGAFPVISDTEGGAVVFDSFGPWLRINMTAGAGTTNGLKGILYGWRVGPPVSRSALSFFGPGGLLYPWTADIEGTTSEAFGVVIDEAHYRIHEGQAFQSFASQSLLANATHDYLVIVPALPNEVHFTYTFDCTAPMALSIFEAPTTTANGAAVPVFNANRNSATVNLTLVFNAPTVTGTGTLIDGGVCGSGTGAGRVGSEQRNEHEWILKAGAKYLLRTAVGGNAAVVTSSLNWYSVP